MSQFQKLTAKSAPNIYEYTEWKHLTSEEKREFGLAFIGKSRTDSEASDQLDSLRESKHRDSIYFAERMIELKKEESGLVNNHIQSEGSFSFSDLANN